MKTDETLIAEVRRIIVEWFRHDTPERAAIQKLITAYRIATATRQDLRKRPRFKRKAHKEKAKFMLNLPPLGGLEDRQASPSLPLAQPLPAAAQSKAGAEHSAVFRPNSVLPLRASDDG